MSFPLSIPCHMNANSYSQTITGDLGGSAKTHEYAAAVIAKLA
jgi:hypothetical protein